MIFQDFSRTSPGFQKKIPGPKLNVLDDFARYKSNVIHAKII
jgi:hypothetical protein